MPRGSPLLPLPPRDVEYRLAFKLLAAGNALDREVLLSLVGRPLRYSEMRPLLRGRQDHNLTMALGRLRRDGLLRQRSDVRQSPPVNAYELSHLGRLVVLRMMQMVPAQESARILLRGKAAAEDAA